MKEQYRWHVLCLCFLCISGLLSAQNKKPVFTDVTSESGIDFRYTIGDYSYENILESSGSGITVFDYDNDGLMDLYMMNGTYLEGISDDDGKVFQNTRNKLYKNKGDGTFSEVSQIAGVDDPNWSMAAGIVDLDRDGFQDLYLLNYGDNVFYHNNTDGTFSDITDSLGLGGPEKLNGFQKWSIGVSFWDHNLDGRLDAMVGNFLAFDPFYVSTQTPGMMPHPSEYKGQASILYEQQENGKFVDVTQDHNLYYPDSKCMGLSVFDYDNDGDLDIFQANDHQMNFLFRNDQGRYTEFGIGSGVASNSNGQMTGSMHGTLGDVDGDGLIDLLVTDLKYGALYRYLGNGLYKDITKTSGIETTLAGKGSWGAAFLDYDNDGDLDIVAANGTAEELILQYPVLLENDGKGNFKDVGKNRGSYFSTQRSGRGLAIWDYDNDGDMDIIVSHVDFKEKPALLRNDGGNENHWLGLTLTGKHGLTTGMGARITVVAGEHKQVFVNQWSTGYLSNSEPRVHIGLGKQKKINEINIKWSDGQEEVFRNIEADQYLNIVKGKGILSE